jgi:hypothetical protein
LSNLTVLYCFQNIHQLQAQVTLELSDLSISNSFPPAVNESSTQLITTAQNGNGTQSPLFELYANYLLTTLSPPSDIEPIPPPPGETGPNNLDNFTIALVQGEDGVPIDQLVGDENQQAFISAVQNLHSKYMAQAISLNWRTTNSSASQPLQQFQASVTSTDRLRLQQNLGPKIALQVMLGIMVVCALASFILLDTRNVLPYNPCTIAGTASLVVGSKMCSRDMIPEGAEWMSDNELQMLDVFKRSNVFSLGWWQDEVSGRWRFGIDLGRADQKY